MHLFAGYRLPAGLIRLINNGVWPGASGPSMTAQQFNPIVTPQLVTQFAADETRICLQPPPFRTISEELASGGAGHFWDRFGALNEIVAADALVIGDFGLGSDAPIILAFDRHKLDPPVLRLRWEGNGADICTHWVEGAKNFDEFAEMLGLSSK